MQVSDEIKNSWLELKEQGDTTIIANELKMAPPNVSVILHTGKGSVKQISFISKYFKKRKLAVKKIEDDNN